MTRRPVPTLLHPLRAARVRALWLVLMAAGPPAWSQADADALAWRGARAAALAGSQQWATAQREEKEACDAAESADRALMNSPDDQPTTLARLALSARQQYQRCVSARLMSERRKAAWEASREELRGAALRLARCTATTCPGATVAQATVAQAPATAASQVADAVAQAAKAQGQMDKLRKKAAPVYDLGDAATAAALTLDFGTVPDPGLQTLLDGWAYTAQHQPRVIRRGVTLAQHAADAAVEQALRLKGCGEQGRPCPADALAAAQDALQDLKKRSDAAEKQLTELQTANYGLASAEALKSRYQPGGNKDFEATLERQITLRRLLDQSPDVKSFFGGDAVGLSAGTADSSSSIRLARDIKGPLGNNRYTLIASTPTSSSGTSRLVDSVDKIKGKTSLQLVVQNVNPAFDGSVIGYVSDFAVGAGIARSQRSYLLVDPASGRLTDAGGSYNDATVGLRWAFLNAKEDKATGLVVLSASRQRYYKDSTDTGVHCDPVRLGKPDEAVPLSCRQGTLGAPTRAYNTVVGLDYRVHANALDFALKLQRSSEKKTDFELPIYLIRNLDAVDKDMPLTGGISLGWSSSNPGVKWSLFVATPLSFGKIGRPSGP